MVVADGGVRREQHAASSRTASLRRKNNGGSNSKMLPMSCTLKKNDEGLQPTLYSNSTL